MSKKTADIKRISSELNKALRLLNDEEKQLDANGKILCGVSDGTDSLLKRCGEIVSTRNINKPVLRLIHHFACSGGTLIAKCLSALPNVHLISEVHPNIKYHYQNKDIEYRPTDIAYLACHANIPMLDQFTEDILVSNILNLSKHLRKYGGDLVLRDHTHMDYCTGVEVSNPTLIRLLEPHFELVSLITVRNPIDSFLSLSRNNWVGFKPANFEEYCSRYIRFITDYANTEFIRYEDFVAAPESQMKKVSKILALEFSDSFNDIFSLFKVTGDSGRSSDKIETRKRREIPDEIALQISQSESYRQLANMLGYNPES